MGDETNQVHFLTAYVAQQRAEIAGDKTSLGQFFLAKAALAGALVTAAAIERETVVMVVGALLPFALMVLDFLYRKRLNEIFRRWKNLQETVLPRVKAAANLGEMRLFEDDLIDNADEIMREERLIKTVVLVPSLLFSVIAARLVLGGIEGLDGRLADVLGFAAYPAVVVGFYALLFETRKDFGATYVTPALAVAGAVGIAAGVVVDGVGG